MQTFIGRCKHSSFIASCKASSFIALPRTSFIALTHTRCIALSHTSFIALTHTKFITLTHTRFIALTHTRFYHTQGSWLQHTQGSSAYKALSDEGYIPTSQFRMKGIYQALSFIAIYSHSPSSLLYRHTDVHRYVHTHPTLKLLCLRL